MVRAVLSLVGILAVGWVMLMLFGYTTPQVTESMPALNRSVLHTVELETSTATENGREPTSISAPSAPTVPAPASSDNSSASLPPQALEIASDSGAEVISPSSTSHLNPDHIRDVNKSATADGESPATNRPAFVPPNPLPAHPHWTWEVQSSEFNNVVVTHVDADLVTITSDSGTTQIDIGLLPPEIRQELHYDPLLAAEAAAARKNAAAATNAATP
jgi:hypothetical protein